MANNQDPTEDEESPFTAESTSDKGSQMSNVITTAADHEESTNDSTTCQISNTLNINDSGNGKMDTDVKDNKNDNDDIGLHDHNVNFEYEFTKESENDNRNLPIDRGWAWVILAASIAQNFIIVGQMKCFGIFFVQIQSRFQTSSSLTSLVFTLQNATYSVGALLVMNIGQSISPRLMVIVGAVISVGMLLVTAFTENFVVLNLVLGIGSGASYAMIQPSVTAVLCAYFDKYRGLANSLYCGGVSLGGLVLAPFFTKTLEYYGYTGTYIVSAGLHAQLAIVGALLRPLNVQRSSIETSYTGSRENVDIKETEKMITTETGLRKRVPLLSESESVTSTGSKMSRRVMDSFLNSRTARYASSSMLNSSVLDLSMTRSAHMHDETTDTHGEIKKRKSFRQHVRGLILRVFDIEVVKMPVFQYYFVCTIFLCAGCAVISANVPPHAFDVGIDADNVALLVSMNSVVDVLSKIVFGYAADKNCIQRSRLVSICTFVLGIVCQFFYFMNTFAILMAFSVFIGLLHGVYFNVCAVILLDFLGEDKFKAAFGIICLAQGMSVAVAFPIAGALRDYTGHWHASYTFVGILLLVGSVMLWFLPTVTKRSKRKPSS